MEQTLSRLARAGIDLDAFDTRRAFGQRVGNLWVIPPGVGPGLQKAVREGYLEPLDARHRRKGRRYAVTMKGRALLLALGGAP